MKSWMIPVAAVALLAGCSKSETGVGKVPEDRVPVRLSAGATDMSSRAPINTGDVFTASIAGWETNAEAADYAATPAWMSEAGVAASAGKDIVLAPEQFYHADEAVTTYIKGWYPAGTPAGGKVVFDNADGTADAMMAGAVAGSKMDFSNKVLVFKHPSTQIKFEVVADGLQSGTRLESIQIQGAELPVGFDLENDCAIYESVAGGVLDIPGIAATEIPEQAVPVGLPVMVKPFDSNTILLNIKTSAYRYQGVAAVIDNDAKFLPGKAYTITLTFRRSEVQLSASVTAWDDSGMGSATID